MSQPHKCEGYPPEPRHQVDLDSYMPHRKPGEYLSWDDGNRLIGILSHQTAIKLTRAPTHAVQLVPGPFAHLLVDDRTQAGAQAGEQLVGNGAAPLR